YIATSCALSSRPLRSPKAPPHRHKIRSIKTGARSPRDSFQLDYSIDFFKTYIDTQRFYAGHKLDFKHQSCAGGPGSGGAGGPGPGGGGGAAGGVVVGGSSNSNNPAAAQQQQQPAS
ncbi:uncharacterized protein Dsimw501_GD26924, partial [Drosophila simulans]